MPNLIVGLVAAFGCAGAAAGGTVCGAFMPDSVTGNLHVYATVSDIAVDTYECNGPVIDFNKYRVDRLCIDYQSATLKSQTNGNKTFAASGCTVKSVQCSDGFYVNESGGEYLCFNCADGYVALSLRWLYQNQADQINGLAYHSYTSCNYCGQGYYRSGASCVMCPDVGTGFILSSWGDGGIETCMGLRIIDSDNPSSTNGSDNTGTYVQTVDTIVTDWTDGTPYQMCSYK